MSVSATPAIASRSGVAGGNKTMNIIILGAGFGGLRTALKLSKKLKHRKEYKIILIDKNSYQTYTPALYEVATAYRGKDLKTNASEQDFEENLAGSSVFILRTILARRKNIEFVQGEVKNINLDTKNIFLKSEDMINYQYCVIALGAQTAFYGVEGANTCCHTLKTLSGALNIRHKVEAAFQKAVDLSTGDSQLASENNEVHLLTIGAGLSGFEVVTEMAKHCRHLRFQNPSLNKSKVKIKLIEAKSKILTNVPDKMRDLAEKRLKYLDIEVLTDTRVARIEPDKVILENGVSMPADVSIWTGGVEGLNLFQKINGVPLDKNGKILVEKSLLVKKQRDIFALGDCSYFYDEKLEIAVPATAWAAEEQADIVWQNILRDIDSVKMLEYKSGSPGFVSSAGGKYAIAHLYGITFSGFNAWVLKRLIDLKYILSIYPYVAGMRVWYAELDLWIRND